MSRTAILGQYGSENELRRRHFEVICCGRMKRRKAQNRARVGPARAWEDLHIASFPSLHILQSGGDKQVGACEKTATTCMAKLVRRSLFVD